RALPGPGVQVTGARAAAAGVAADVRAREGEIVAQEVDEQPASRHLVLVRRPVHGHGHDLLGARRRGHVHPLAFSAACRTARTVDVSARLRRYSADAWTSAGGARVAPRPSTAGRTRAPGT